MQSKQSQRHDNIDWKLCNQNKESGKNGKSWNFVAFFIRQRAKNGNPKWKMERESGMGGYKLLSI